MNEFSSALQEASMLTDLTQVPESALREMSATAHSSVADEASAVEYERIDQEFE